MTTTPAQGSAAWGSARRPVAVRDGRTTTVASLLFILLVIYGGIQLYRVQSALSGVFSRPPFSTTQPSYQAPTPGELNQGDPSGKTQFCFANPTDRSCANAN